MSDDTNINAESDAVRERARKAAADPQFKTSVEAYHATNEQGNFALWNNVFDWARKPIDFGFTVPPESKPMTNPNDPVTLLTKREYFTAVALEGMLAFEGCIGAEQGDAAVAVANAVIAALNESNESNDDDDDGDAAVADDGEVPPFPSEAFLRHQGWQK